MNSPANFATVFKAMRINGGSIIESFGSSKSQEIFSSTTPPSSSPSPVNIEL